MATHSKRFSPVVAAALAVASSTAMAQASDELDAGNVGRDWYADSGHDAPACAPPRLRCVAFARTDDFPQPEAAPSLALAPAPPALKQRSLLHALQLGIRFDFPDSRDAGHGPWFLQFKVSRRAPAFQSPTFTPPRHTVGTLTIGTEF